MSMQIIEVIRGVKKVVDATVNPGDDVLILGSTDINPVAYEALATACSAMGCEITLAMISPRGRFHAEEPPNAVAKAMFGADVVFQCLSTSLAHTQACANAGQAGVRQVSMYLPKGQEIDVLKRFESIDLRETRRYTISGQKLILDAMKQGREVHVTSDLGADFRCLLREDIDEVNMHYGITVGPDKQPLEQFTAWPPAAIHPFVDEESANGVFIIDASVDAVGPLSENMKLHFEKGQLTKIEGGIEAKKFESILEGMDENARQFSFLGMGSSPFVQKTGFVGEHRRRAGTFHIGTGCSRTLPHTLPSSKKIEGHVESNFHCDIVASNVTFVIGGVEIIKKGVPCWK